MAQLTLIARTLHLLGLSLVLAACGAGQNLFQRPTSDQTTNTSPSAVVQSPDTTTLRPKNRPTGGSDSTTGPKTGEGLTAGVPVSEVTKATKSEVAQATKPQLRPEQDKGTTIASLGLLDRSGFWMATPLVKSESEGRAVYLKTGASVNLTLVPNGAAPGSGSQISVTAMQILGIPLTELAELQVFVR